jgi:YVTN family beta-propeller protein
MRRSVSIRTPSSKGSLALSVGGLLAILALGAGVALVLVTGTAARATPDVETRHVRQAEGRPGAPPISSRDRVYTADMSSNTVSVINPKTDKVLGTIPLGTDVLGQILGPVDRSQVGVHGLGFSRDGRLLDVISVNSNAAQLIRTRNNQLATTTYLGRSPHEGFVSPDGKTLWVAVRGQRYIAVLSTQTGREVGRIGTADGPSKVVFSPDGRLAYVNHLRAREVEVVRVRDRRIIKRIFGTAPQSSDEALSPDGRELWLGHPFTGQITVIDAQRMRLLTVLSTGPRTNHIAFVTKPGGQYAYVTVGGLNETLVFRRKGAHPRLVKRIPDHGFGPHGIWPSPDSSRVYVALQNSDAVDVIDTATDAVTTTIRVGQDPMALVYVAGAVPHGDGRRGLTRQGLGRPIENLTVEIRGVPGRATLTVRKLDGFDQLVLNARGLPKNRTLTLEGVRASGKATPLFSIEANARGSVDQALAYTRFLDVYKRVFLTAAKLRRTASAASYHLFCEGWGALPPPRDVNEKGNRVSTSHAAIRSLMLSTSRIRGSKRVASVATRPAAPTAR